MIEKGTMADLDELEQLYHDLIDHLACRTNYPGWKKGIYPVRKTAAAGIEEGNLFVYREKGRIAGTVILNHEVEAAYSKADWRLNLEVNTVYVVHTLAVHPLNLKSGIGRKLMEFMIEHSIQMKAKAIRLDVYEKNMPAIQLYQKYGFQYIDTVDLGYGNYGLDLFDLYQKVL